MKCRWHPDAMSGIVALPTAVTDTQLRLAGAAQLKVLLWWARNGGDFDPEACSRAVGFSPLDCVDALRYWQEVGVLLLDDAPAVARPVTPAAPAATTEAEAPADTRLPVRRPYALKPEFGEVMEKQQSDGDYAALLTVTEARLGRCLSHADMQTLLYLRDTAGLPGAVIIMVIEYAVAHGHGNMRYIEKTALGWVDDGLTTVEAAEAYLRAVERRERAAAAVEGLLALPKALKLAEATLADTWLNEWKMESDVILMADEICRKKTGKTVLNYIHRVLESWHLDGARTVDAVLALLGKKPPTEATETSLDMDAYEEIVARFRPHYSHTSDGEG